ncbi:MAG: hypothetical protein QXH33_07335, partial [Candidatus Nitrosocaldus sp.]
SLLLSMMLLMINTDDDGSNSNNAYATHTSLPVIEPMEQYIAGRVYDINGLILYNGEPTSDVLVEVKIDSPDGSSTKEYVRSRDDGRFTMTFKPNAQGYYTITATSHCRDVHRSICTYQSTMLEVAVYEEKSIDRLCVVGGGECINLDNLTIAMVDARLSEDVMIDSSKRALMIRLMDVGDRAHIILTLPSHIIDAPDRLSVVVDGKAVEHREHLASSDVRIVEIPIYDGGSVVVEIIGTYVIPEFPIAIALVLAVSMLVLLTLHRLQLIGYN